MKHNSKICKSCQNNDHANCTVTLLSVKVTFCECICPKRVQAKKREERKMLNPIEPARIEAKWNDWAIYQQNGRYYLYNQVTGQQHNIPQPKAWLTNNEKIATALANYTNF